MRDPALSSDRGGGREQRVDHRLLHRLDGAAEQRIEGIDSPRAIGESLDTHHRPRLAVGNRLRGGEGGVVGTLIGAFIMGLLSNGSDLLGTNPYWQQVIIGAVIILAVSFDALRKRRMTA